MKMEILFAAVYSAFWLAAALPAMRVIQSLSYRPERGYARIEKTNEFISCLILNLMFAAAFVLFGKIAAIAFVTVNLAYVVWLRTVKKRTLYRKTNRILRQYVTNYIILILLSIIWLPLGGLLCYLVPVVGLWVNRPIEMLINRKFINQAVKKIRNSRAIKVIITGSYGKTSVKNYLKTLLSEKYKVLATPESYNTPLGIALTVNNSLSDETEIFIAEAGARQKGDILEICEMIEPDLGVIVGIAPQHIQTFGTLNEIISTKFELVNYINKKFNKLNYKNKLEKSCIKKRKPRVKKVGKTAPLNQDLKSKMTCNFLKKADCSRDGLYYNIKKRFIYSNNCELLKNEVKFRECDGLACGKGGFIDIRLVCSSCKSSFESDILRITNGQNFLFNFGNLFLEGKCHLFAESEIDSLCVAAGAAYSLGLMPEEIVRAASTIKSVAHRAEVKFNGNIFIIDDSYNCSTESAKSSITLLDSFFGKKMCITPGIVEGGNLQVRLNFEIGTQLAKVCDWVCIVGPNADAIEKGLLSESFHKESIFRASTPENAVKMLAPYFSHGDVLLFLNDVPDDYL